jgi:general secretion pathway protein B
MSFILDALKKSETERQQQTGAEFSSVPSSSDDPPSMKWLWILIGLLAVNMAVLLGILLRPDAPAPALAELPTPAVETVPAQPSAGPSFEEQVAVAREQQAEKEIAAAEVLAEIPQESVLAADPAPAASTTTAAPRPVRRVQTFDEVRMRGSLQVPDLHLDIHVYSEVPDQRFVFINMVKHREQSRLDEGPVVSEITPEGVILDYQGTSFLLSRQ